MEMGWEESDVFTSCESSVLFSVSEAESVRSRMDMLMFMTVANFLTYHLEVAGKR